MGNKKFLFISILILAVGFASVSTTLYISGKVAVSTKKSDFDVYFSGAELDGEDVSNIVIKDKKHIEFASNELKAKDDTSILKYEVTNDSTEYDATVTISCTPMKTAYFDVTLNPDTFDIDAGEVKTGEIEAKLIKVSEVEQNINIDCELSVVAKERTSVETILEKNDNYAISGNLTTSENEKLSGKDILIKSESQIIKTGRNGYFYVDNLERGMHHIYYKEDGDYEINDEVLEEYLIAEVSTNGNIKIINKNYKINNLQYGKSLVDEGIYCEYEEGEVWDFPYNGTNGSDGSIQEFTVSKKCNGVYKIELWGASGGDSNESVSHGYGGYSTGTMNLEENDKLYIGVGGAGESNTTDSRYGQRGGYNGGGDGGNATVAYISGGGGGGGATHISTTKNTLYELRNDRSSVLMVAGGAGGSCVWTPGGSGGGMIGAPSLGSQYYSYSVGGEQGRGYEFGLGQKGRDSTGGWYGSRGNGGGGGGYFGGYAIQSTGDYSDSSGGGGSGYINTSSLSNKSMYCYDCTESTAEETKTINTLGITVGVDKTNCPLGYSSDAISKCAKDSHGHARITLISFD